MRLRGLSVALVIILATGLTVGAASAYAAPETRVSSGQEKVKKPKKAKKPKAVDGTETVTPPVPDPQVALWEEVIVYAQPLNINPRGLVVPMYKEIKTGYLGYARATQLLTGTAYPYTLNGVNQYTYRAYNPVFDSTPDFIGGSCGWGDPDHRITYAYPGWTVVSVNGIDMPYTSNEAQAALSTPGVTWQAEYRERYSTYGFLGWNVIRYRPAN